MLSFAIAHYLEVRESIPFQTNLQRFSLPADYAKTSSGQRLAQLSKGRVSQQKVSRHGISMQSHGV